MAVRSTTTFAEVLALTGMTQAEAAEYLEISLPTVRAYCQGSARTKPDKLIALWELYVVIRDGRPAGHLPARAPQSVRRRLNVANDLWQLIEKASGAADPYLKLRKHLDAELAAMKGEAS